VQAARRRRLELAMPWLVIVGLLVLWQAVVKLFGVASFVLPAPSAILDAFLQSWITRCSRWGIR
jgi:NitT/TauT family transport system permease protein